MTENIAGSTALIEAVKKHIKESGPKAFTTIATYGGEFSSVEIDTKSFTAPAVFVSNLGWRHANSNPRLATNNSWQTRVVLFIVTKATKRENRMQQAMERAEWLTAIFTRWLPDGLSVSSPHDIQAENLYTRTVDAKGLALWMVSWWQELEIKKAPPTDLQDLETVEVTTTATVTVNTEDQQSGQQISDFTIEHKLGVKDGE